MHVIDGRRQSYEYCLCLESQVSAFPRIISFDCIVCSMNIHHHLLLLFTYSSHLSARSFTQPVSQSLRLSLIGWLIPLLSHSLIPSLASLLMHSSRQSITPLFPHRAVPELFTLGPLHLLIQALTNSSNDSLTHPLTYCLTHLLIYSVTFSLTRSIFPHSLPRSHQLPPSQVQSHSCSPFTFRVQQERGQASCYLLLVIH